MLSGASKTVAIANSQGSKVDFDTSKEAWKRRVTYFAIHLRSRRRRFFFVKSLRKFCRKFAESCKEYVHCVRKGCGKFAEISRKFANIFCNDHFPNDPMSELLTYCSPPLKHSPTLYINLLFAALLGSLCRDHHLVLSSEHHETRPICRVCKDGSLSR